MEYIQNALTLTFIQQLRRFLSILCLGLLLAGAYPAIASAHVVRTDGSISVELHIQPNDHPISGQNTTYLLEFSDNDNKFDLKNCDCTISFQQAGKVVATRQAVNHGTNVSENQFTFPKPGSYTLHLSGKPEQTGQFQPFTLAWPIQVAAPASNSIPTWAWVIGGTGIVAVIGTGILLQRGERGSRKSS